MPNRNQPQWTVTGMIEAPVDAVWAALIASLSALTPAQKRALTQPDAQPLVATNGTPGAGRIHLEVTPRHHCIAIQGEWWYRGVQRLVPHGSQGSACRLIHEVYNIAPGLGWWAAQWVQGPQHARQMGGQCQAQLDAMGRQLICATWLETAV